MPHDTDEDARLREAELAVAALAEAVDDLILALSALPASVGASDLATKLLLFATILEREEGAWAVRRTIRERVGATVEGA